MTKNYVKTKENAVKAIKIEVITTEKMSKPPKNGVVNY